MTISKSKPETHPSHHPFQGRLGTSWPDLRLGKILAQRVRGMVKYFPYEIQMDRAHTVMLSEQNIISPSDAAQILRILNELESEGFDESQIDGTKSTIFWYVEDQLIKRLGIDIGGRMHTGRSHNDIIPTLSRMNARHLILELSAVLLELRHSLIKLSESHIETVMPGYTSLQHGQPWTFGHYLIGWDHAFSRDFERLESAFQRTNKSSLGGSALVGSSWPLNRQLTADLLGFEGVMWHSRDAGFGTKDYVAESLAVQAILMSHLSTLCSDLYLWSSFEFGMIEIDDNFCGTSSIMPQKKNAWALDWTRGAAGNSVGYFASCLSALRGSSSTDAMAQEYPEWALTDAFKESADYVSLITGVIDSLKVNKPLMLERAKNNWSTASNLADAMVRHASFSFREAHSIVGQLVRHCLSQNISPDHVTIEIIDLMTLSMSKRPCGLTQDQIKDALDPLQFIKTRVTHGSVNFTEVHNMINAANDELLNHTRIRDAHVKKLKDASVQLESATAQLLSSHLRD